MTIYIVMVNGNVDKLFTNFVAAENYRLARQKEWSITKIIVKEVDGELSTV